MVPSLPLLLVPVYPSPSSITGTCVVPLLPLLLVPVWSLPSLYYWYLCVLSFLYYWYLCGPSPSSITGTCVSLSFLYYWYLCGPSPFSITGTCVVPLLPLLLVPVWSLSFLYIYMVLTFKSSYHRSSAFFFILRFVRLECLQLRDAAVRSGTQYLLLWANAFILPQQCGAVWTDYGVLQRAEPVPPQWSKDGINVVQVCQGILSHITNIYTVYMHNT